MKITALSIMVSSAAFAGTVNESGSYNNTIATAQSIDGSFTPNADPNVFGTGPTVSIAGHLDAILDLGNGSFASDRDLYSFTLASAGSAWFDVDDTLGQFDSFLSLFDAAGTLIAMGDDGDSGNLDPGSTSGTDSFIGIINLAAGTYYIAIGHFGNAPAAAGSNSSATQLDRPDGFYGGEQLFGATTGDSAFTHDDGTGAEDLSYTLHVTLSVVPLPSTGALGAAGLLAIAVRRRR